jgi:hypothetical protein
MKLADNLMELRNRVAHNRTRISNDDARAYVNAVSRVIEALYLAQSPRARGWVYEEEVLAALRRTTAGIAYNKRDIGVDAFTRLAGGQRAAIIIKFGSVRPISIQELEKKIESARADLGQEMGILVITNLPLAEQVRAFNATSNVKIAPTEVITWSGPQDDDLLTRALGRVSQVF